MSDQLPDDITSLVIDLNDEHWQKLVDTFNEYLPDVDGPLEKVDLLDIMAIAGVRCIADFIMFSSNAYIEEIKRRSAGDST